MPSDAELLENIVVILNLTSDEPLTPAVRAALQLARRLGLEEYALYFELMLSGVRVGEEKPMLWRGDASKLAWQPAEVFAQDRTGKDGLIQGHALSVIEDLQKRAAATLRDSPNLGHSARTDLIKTEMALSELRLRLRTRLEVFAAEADEHLRRADAIKPSSVGAALGQTEVFIGHGRSTVWLQLRDLLQDRLGLEWQEFNREPPAGLSTKERLEKMLSSAGFAFLVLTAEDEHQDGRTHARENVIHEAGLFQGRLGFSRAIILLEEDCAEFSNISGLGQIRFSPGNLKGVSEEIRRVLERERVLAR